MRLRVVAAAAVCASLTLGVAAASAVLPARSTSPQAAQATTLRVWLQVDAQQNWEGAVNAASNKFEAAHPGTQVKVEYQTWNDHLTKFDASLAGNNAPDVIELGNTEMTKYMAAGAFADITSAKRSIPNSSTWLKGLTDSSMYKGKLYGVPYYAGARGVIYRTDHFKAAGIKKVPTSLDQYEAALAKLQKKFGKDRRYSSLYFPGQYWLASMSFVYDYGGKIAELKGDKWKGTLDSPQAIQALTRLKRIVTKYSKANKTGDEANPAQALVFGKGKVGSIIANGWEWGYALNKDTGNPSLENKIGAFPMPSHTPGKYMPTFLGGSNLAIPVTSRNRQLALDWIKEFTGTDLMRYMATVGKVLPNTTSLTSVHKTNKQVAPFARAASSSWFVPAAANWVNVENKRIIRNMLVRIFSGRGSVASEAKKASKAITEELNRGS
jgi:N,N'-diacetylchitobiose transport system substrate-binding protein